MAKSRALMFAKYKDSADWNLLARTIELFASLCDWFTGLFTFLVIGQKLLFVYWLLRGTLFFYCLTGPRAMVNEYSCVCLHSDRSPQERKANLQAFKVTIISYTKEVSAIRTEGRLPLVGQQFGVVVWLHVLQKEREIGGVVKSAFYYTSFS